MWFFPVLSLLTGAGIVAILVQMYLQPDLRSQLILSLLAFAAVLVFFFANSWFIARRAALPGVPPSPAAHRVLVLANDSLGSGELHAALRQIGADRDSVFQVVVPVSPVDTGVAAAHGPLDVWAATREVADERLGVILGEMRAQNLTSEGILGDQNPRVALAEAVDAFRPDQIVIATPPPEESVWNHYDVVDRARADYGVPVTHVICAAETPSA
jgi:GABA permease